MLFTKLIGARWKKEAEAVEKARDKKTGKPGQSEKTVVRKRYLPPKKLAAFAEKRKQVARPNVGKAAGRGSA